MKQNVTIEPVEELLTISEVAKRLRVDGTTCRRWVHLGVLDAVELPHMGKRRGYRIKKSTLDALMSAPVIV